MNILIVGCGDTGSQLANVLDHMGNQVSVVDRNPETAAELSDSFTGMFTVGVPIDQDVLRHAGIEGCDVVIAVTRDDNTNLMVAQLARDIFGVPKVISRVSDPRPGGGIQQLRPEYYLSYQPHGCFGGSRTG